jgi:hypothetical protein
MRAAQYARAGAASRNAIACRLNNVARPAIIRLPASPPSMRDESEET